MWRSLRSRRAAAVAVALIATALVVTPAGAHVSSNVSHVWTKHFKPLALKLFYTKSQSDARYPTRSEADSLYYRKTDSDARYYTQTDADARFALKGEGDLQRYCGRARANPRSYPAELCDAPLTMTLDAVGNVGGSTSIAIGTDGVPIISYRDAASDDLKILHCGNATCTAGNLVTLVDAGADAVGLDSSIAIGVDGLPVVSYYDATNTELELLHCGNVACTSGNQTTTIAIGGGAHSSLAIGTDGLPVVAYFDAAGGDLAVVHCGDAACTSGNQGRSLDAGPVLVGQETSVAIGTNGFPVISYLDVDNGDLKLARCGNVACTSGTEVAAVDTTPAFVGEYTSLAIGIDGFPVVSYRDATNGDLKVLHCGNAACTSGNEATAVDTAAGLMGYDTALAIGLNGLPVVSYYNATDGDLKFLACGNAACNSGNDVSSIDTAGNVGRFASVAIGVDGLPLVSYYDETNGDLKVARPAVS